ncbi:polymorphic toxin-type HINT domain-containing protein [Nonomuraea sp. NPDC049758]|uniref:polymorphic toxin-type HINT domain-containing protein n=1 Tax=Nonomuraea sp. NPDC049758 TaxID=3154360 RepID=UPI0034156D0F
MPLEDRAFDSAPADATEGLPAGTLRAEAAERSVLAVPTLADVYPKQGYLVDSLTPSLRAWGQSSNGAYPVSYSFELCDVESMSGPACVSSGFVGGNANKWTVPAGTLVWGKQYWWRVTVKDSSDSSTTTSSVLTFTTGVRQSVLSSTLAGPDGFNQQNGNFTTTATDLEVATVGPPLSVVRTYNSLDPRTDALFGAGWSTRWDMRISSETHGTAVSAVLTYPDGRRVRFRSDGGGGFQPPPGMFSTLVQRDGWRLMDKAGTNYLFGTDGRLAKIRDNRNRTQELIYGSDGKLAKVSTVGGRSLTFTWNGSHVTSVSSDPVNGTALTWTYAYDGDRLTQACAPVAVPNCTTYDYGTGSLYRSGVLDEDAFGYWRLDEASGSTAKDLGTGAGDATYQSVTLGQQGALAGTTDTAASFGTGARLSLPAHAIAHVGNQMAVETWFKTSGSGVLLAAGAQQSGGAAEGPMLYVGTDGKLRGSLTETATPITSGQAVNDGQWHHVVLSVEDQQQTLFLDGQQTGTLTSTRPAGWRQYATVGSGIADAAISPAVPAGTTAFAFQGVIDEVALYGAPLGLRQVKAHYQARNATPNRLTKITLPSGRVQAVNTYDDKSDRIATHTDSNGGTWKIGGLGVEQQSGEAQVTVTDPNNNPLISQFDAWRGYRIRSRSDQLGYSTRYEYNQAGFLAKVTDRNDLASEIYQDKRGNTLGRQYCRAPGQCAIEFWSYYLNPDDPLDPRNDKVTAYRDGRSARSNDNTYATTLEYNTFGEPTKQTTPISLDFPLGRSTTTAYTDGTEPAVGGGTSPPGLVKTSTDARGNAVTFKYTAKGDLAEQSDPEGLVTAFEQDALGRLTAKTQLSDAVPAGVKITFGYDAAGRLATRTTPGVKNEITGVTHTAQTSYSYDPDGHPLTATVMDLTGGDSARATTYTYDAYGRQETVTDPEGGVLRTNWDKLGLPTTLTDPLGSVFGYTFTKRGELEKRTLKNYTGSPVNPKPAEEITLESFSYDPGGRLAAKADAMGRKTSYTYYADNLLFQVVGDDVKLNGSTTTDDVILEANTYDPAGNLTKKETAGRVTTSTPSFITTTNYVYDAAGLLTSQTFDPAKLARKTVYTYDAAGNVTAEQYSATGTTRSERIDYTYDKKNNLTGQKVENDAQDLISSWTVDDRGLVVRAVDPRGNVPGADSDAYTTTYRYDTAGQLVETKAPTVQVEKNNATQATRPTTRRGYDTMGNQTHVLDGEGRLTTSAFDRADRLTSVTGIAYTPPGGTALIPKTAYSYDAAGRLVKTTDPRGAITTAEYDALDNLVRLTDPPAAQGQTAGTWLSEYDLLGELRATVDPTGARQQFTYDDLGRQIARTAFERKPATASYTTDLQYNDAGDLTKVTLPGNKVTSYTVNAAGEVTTQTDPATNATLYEYDLAGRPAKVTDAEGNSLASEYDLAGRLTGLKRLDKNGVTVRAVGYGYDVAGNLTQYTSGEGHVTRRVFDATSLLTELVEPVSSGESITTSFGYDATGARTRTTDGRGNATWSSYNTLGLIETLTEPATTAHPNLADRTWTHLYDAAGNETALIKPGGVRLDRQYDNLSRVTKISGSGAGIVAQDKTYGYDLADRATTVSDQSLEYNDRGLLTKVTAPSGQSTAFAYDALGNPTQRVDVTGTTTYTWDNNNRLRTVTDPVSGRTNTYDYDKADRLTTITSANPVNTQSYTYDALDRPLTHTLKNSSGGQLSKIAYGWDKDDNLTSKTTEGLAGAGSNTYGYDQAGRLTSWTGPDGTTTSYAWDASGNRVRAGTKTYTYDERNRLTEGDGSTYTYSPRGTMASQIKNGNTRNLTFDAFDRLINDGDATYTYDAFDRMATRQNNAGQQRFVYAGLSNDIIAITDQNGAPRASYGRDPFGDLVSVKEGGNPAAAALTDLHQDLVGSFSGTALTGSTAYNPFGEVTAQTGTKSGLGYQSGYTDPDTGTVNMHARWYQPGTAAFVSRDDWSLEPNPSVQVNRYTYANASPLLNRDPTGHVPDPGGGSWGNGCGYDWYYQQTALPKKSFYPGGGTGACGDNKDKGKGKGKNNGEGTESTVESQGRSESRQPPPGGNRNNTGHPTGGTPGKGKAKKKKKDKDPEPQTDSGKPKKPRTPPPPSQDVIDNKCAHGACNVSWGGTPSYFNGPVTFGGPDVTLPGVPACSGSCGGPPGITPIGLPDDMDLPATWDPPLEPSDDFWRGVVDSASGIGQGIWDMTCIVCHVIPGFEDAPSLPAEALFGTDPNSPEYKTGYWGSQILPFFIAPEVEAVRPGIGPKVGGRSSRAPCLNSFAAGTQILMADGNRKNIEDVEVGDNVIATNPEAGRTEAKTVTAVHRTLDKHLTDLTVQLANGSISTIHTTRHHPFWEAASRAWKDAGDLHPGDTLQTPRAERVLVLGIRTFPAVRYMYNLTVRDIHTYYIMAGSRALLVHNAGPCNVPSGPVARKAQDTADHVQQHGTPPPGYRGGRTFANDGRNGGMVLPRTDANGNAVTYREWDVNPYTRGVNRGAERVVTGSDGSAYYTTDHYQNFTRFR